MKPLSKEERCPFFFLINFDDNGFFVMPGRGNPVHKHHPKLGCSKHFIPPRFLNESEEDLVRDLANADANLGIMRNAIYAKTGKIFSRANLFNKLTNSSQLINML